MGIKKKEGNSFMKKKVLIAIFALVMAIHGNRIVFAEQSISPAIEPGEYEIYLRSSDTKVIDIQGKSTHNGANVQIYERDNVKNQKFRVVLNDDGTYTFLALHSNKALDVESGGKTPGTNVWQYEANQTDAQKWIIQSCGNGYYNIISKLNGLYLDLKNGFGVNGQSIQVYTGNGTSAQKFQFVKVIKQGSKTIEDGTYRIASKVATNRWVQVPNNSTNNSTVLTVGVSTNKASQKFRIAYQNDGSYIITNLLNGKAMDVRSAGNYNTTPVQQYDANGTDAQRWFILENEDNTYTIVSKSNGLALDIVGGNTASGAGLQTYKSNATKAQKFDYSVMNVIFNT